jgi:GntR family transcriptional regulator/MocR family aminotransferase
MLVWEHLIRPPRHSKGNLSSQLVAALVDAIDENRMPEGVRLPSSRMLADRFGIGRNTVIAAINSLVEQGYLVARGRSGVFVGPRQPAPPPRVPSSEICQRVDWSTRLVSSSQKRSSPVDVGGPIAYNLKYGQFDSSLFPLRHWRECERAASAVTEMAVWGRDVFDRDDQSLVESLRRHVLPRHGIWAGPDEILVTLGGQEGRYLVATLLCRPGTVTGIENPGLPDANDIVSAMPSKRVYLPLDDEGVVPSTRLNECNVIFLTPGHQCPTGRVMSDERRSSVLEIARRRDLIIVEDTYEAETVALKSSVPALKSLDVDDRVIHIGSLSKAIAPGLRVGFVVANRAVIDELREIRRLIHRHPPGNTQRALALFIDRGHYHSFIARVSSELERRSAAFKRSAAKWLPDVFYAHHPGSSTFWMTFPKEEDLRPFYAKLRGQGIFVESGDRFFFEGERYNCVRMSVSQMPEAAIDRALRVAAENRRHAGT